MWDWELLKNGSGKHRYEIIGQYGNENFQYTHAVSYGSQEDEFCMHNHAMYEIVYCVRGDAVYMAEGVRYELEPNGLLIINPTVPHKLFLSSTEPFERHILYIYYARNTTDMSSLIAYHQPPVGQRRIGSAYFSPQHTQELMCFFNQMSKTSRSEKDGILNLMQYFAQAVIAQVSMIIQDNSPTTFSTGASRTLDTLIAYISQNYTQDLTLQGIADTFHMSKDYCNRLFREATGMTIMQFILYNRVLYAKQLLAEGVPASEVSRKAGYSDYSNFFRAYKKVTGRTPSDDYEISETMIKIPSPP